ncbi:MAG TPA: helix-turn-helix domain-containing protein [Chitinophagaceae bacterium]|nr:helix-turn-helix domain-containing protein [Chitinophagaceae bacterium]
MKKITLETCTRSLIPIRDTLNILNGKWKIPVMFSLMFNDLRFKELERELKGITPKMLAKELRELEINQLIKKTPIGKNGDAYEYSITDYGRTLKRLITEIEMWGITHRDKIMGKKLVTNP